MNMAKKYSLVLICILIIQTFLITAAGAKGESEQTRHEIDITIKTTHGTILLELYPDDAPETVENFMKYYNDNFYGGLIFHRVIEDFMIQGGGFYPDLTQKTPTYPAVKNEAAASGHRNLRGTIAMARTSAPDSATCQFYINHKDNPSLDWDQSSDGVGYCVFGKVTAGLDVVDSIAAVATNTEDVPVEDILISDIVVNSGDDDDDDDDNGDDDDTNGGNGGFNPNKKPSNPKNVRIEAGDSYIEVTWSKPSDNGAASIYEYNICRVTSSGGQKQLATVDASVTSYTDTTVKNGQVYYYYVIAVNAYTESDPSFEVSETPQKAVVGSPGFGVISLLGITAVVAVCLMRKKR